MSKIRRYQRSIGDPALLVAFPACKIEYPVPVDRAAQGEPKLPPLEEWVRIGGIAVQSWIGGQLVVAKEIEGRAVKMVGPRAGDHVDRPGVSNTGREIEIYCRQLELLHHFVGEA